MIITFLRCFHLQVLFIEKTLETILRNCKKLKKYEMKYSNKMII